MCESGIWGRSLAGDVNLENYVYSSEVNEIKVRVSVVGEEVPVWELG